jgi:glutamate-ammonia-ligase adenylyltransferase
MHPSYQSAFEHGLSTLPEALRPVAAVHWAELPVPPEGLPALDPAWAESAARVLACSDFVARACAAQPGLLAELLLSGDLVRAGDEARLAKRVRQAIAGCADEAALKRALRQCRQREMVRIAWRDLAGWAGLDETLASLTALADACLDSAYAQLFAWAVARDGAPRAADGRPARFVVIGLGKHGGQELNFSSDIDLIFAYTDEGQTDRSGLSNHEFFLRLGQHLINALNEATADGFVFRVDMRLRPNGASGPLVLSFDAMEQYYQAHGRMWERYAFIKARAVAGDPDAGTALLTMLRPFVFRRYLDYTAVEEIRGMKAAIHRELLRKGIESNIKLGPGGIREVEFIGQAFQLIRGGRDPRLQERRILPVLAQLAAEGDLTAQAGKELREAYVFLRNTEHRLQEINDQQTQVLPTGDLDRLRVAAGMGFGDWAAFHAALARHMRRVHEHFQSVFAAPQGEAPAGDDHGLHAVWTGALDETTAQGALARAGYADAAGALHLLRELRAGGAYSALSANGRERLDRLMPLLLGAAGLTSDANITLARLIHLVEAIGRRSVYLALLVENPLALSQLVKLAGASEWIAQYLSAHPILLDELMDPAGLYAPLARDALAAELQGRLARLPAGDLEAQMDALREFRHGHVLRVAATDIGKGLSPVEIGRHLGTIAEVVVEQALELAIADLVRKHGRPAVVRDGATIYPGFAVIAYGKLGSLELGYTSDLDMIFLHGAGQEPQCREAHGRGGKTAPAFSALPPSMAVAGAAAGPNGGETEGPRVIANEQFFARLGQRLIHVLTARTSGGILYEVDTRLRPSGRSGLLVSHPAAFRDYQREHAWVWEHQALIRARPIAGDAELGCTFEEIRAEILCRERDPQVLRQEVRAMRTRMHEAQAPHDPAEFNLKHDPGGMIDVEFMVQYAVLRWAHDHPELIRHRGNIPLLDALQARGLLDPAQAGLLRDAYLRYLGVEQRLKLMERRPLVAPQELGDFPEQVRVLWREMIEQ